MNKHLKKIGIKKQSTVGSPVEPFTFKKQRAPRKSILEQVYPLVVAVKEIRKVDWLDSERMQEALAMKAMNLLVRSMKK